MKNNLSETDLSMERVFAAPREKVFQAWADPSFLSKWFCPASDWTTPSAEVSLKEGGKYRISMKTPDGRITTVGGIYHEIIPNYRLSFSWAWEKEDEHETKVTIDFKD